METVEQQIQAAGKTAPRITPTTIEATIAEEVYFQPHEAVEARGGQVAANSSIRCLTICVLVLTNGFTVVGKSACASPLNYDEAIGRRVAREDAVRQIWPLLGYELRSILAQGETA